MNEKIYLISAIDCLVGENVSNEIDLGNYVLEYISNKCQYTPNGDDPMWISFPALVLSVKIKNKITGKMEWGCEYFKLLGEYKYNDLFNLPLEEKRSFIFKPETRVLRKKYGTTKLLENPEFFKEFKNGLDSYEYPCVFMVRHLSKEGKESILKFLEASLINLEEKLKNSNSPKLK